MISETMCQALNEQLKWEMYSANLYLSMSGYLNKLGLTGFAHWMRAQYEEETSHAMKFFDYVLKRDGDIQLETIEGPKQEWKDLIDVFEDSLHHESEITWRINNLMKMAKEEGDYASDIFLHWFVVEQVEEEETVRDILAKLKIIGGKGDGVLLMDKELSQRNFSRKSLKSITVE